MLGGIKQGVNFGDGHAFRSVRDLFDPVASADFAFLDHSEIEARSPVGDEESGHFRMAEPQANLEASDARLTDLEDAVADTIPLAYADFRIGEFLDRQVLAEIPVSEIRPAEIRRPITV